MGKSETDKKDGQKVYSCVVLYIVLVCIVQWLPIIQEEMPLTRIVMQAKWVIVRTVMSIIYCYIIVCHRFSSEPLFINKYYNNLHDGHTQNRYFLQYHRRCSGVNGGYSTNTGKPPGNSSHPAGG